MDKIDQPATKLPDTCPSCHESLVVTRLACDTCGTEVSGRFHLPAGRAMEVDDREFVLMFVKTKGNLKQMERESGTSYWTIRRRLDRIAENIDKPAGAKTAQPGLKSNEEARQGILRRVSEGRLNVEQADKLLRAIGTQQVRTIPLKRLDVEVEAGPDKGPA